VKSNSISLELKKAKDKHWTDVKEKDSKLGGGPKKKGAEEESGDP
jgi:hypothetical protein